MGGAGRRQGAPARPTAPRIPICRPARSRSTSREIEVLGPAGELPMPVFGDQEYPEEIRLKYRFLDLRRERLHGNIMKRGADHRFDPAAHEGAGLLRIPDADPDRLLAGGRARLSRAVAHASGQVLRAAAGAAAVQAADHDLGLRPLLPDRALLPRRGRARRPLARRVLPARYRDELRHAGGCVRRGRAGAARRVRGIRRRQAGDAEIPAASPMARRCANTAPTSRTCATRSRCRTSREIFRGSGFKVFARILEERRRRGLGDPRAERRHARLLRPHEFWAQGEGQPGLGYIFWRERRASGGARSARQQYRAGAHRSDPPISSGSRTAMRCFFVAGEPENFVKFAGPRAPRSARNSG